MKCPVCKAYGPHDDLGLRSEGFAEEIITCSTCGAVWAINHGMVEMVNDPQQGSFLEVVSECVEADDYCYAA